MAGVVNVNELLDGHVIVDLECLDRIYLNAYVPNLQVGGQVVTSSPNTLATRSPHQRCSTGSAQPFAGR